MKLKLWPIKNYLAVTSSVFLALGITACTPPPPANPYNACSIFKEYPDWYWASRNSYHRWGVPVSVQLAIIKRESSFDAKARPPREKVLWVIPWSRPTSAYGYAQAVNGTWRQYRIATRNRNAKRTNFADATDFIGWYGDRAHKIDGIAKHDAYRLYLAYYEGIGGYQQQGQQVAKWLPHAAREVARQAAIYKRQLAKCQNNIPKPSFWHSWF